MQPETAEELHPQSKIETLADDAKAYVSTLFELYKLKLTDKIASTGAMIAVYVILIIAIVMVLIMVSIGTAFWINEGVGSSFAGFFVVAGAYLFILGLILIMKNNAVKRPVGDAIIKAMMSDGSDGPSVDQLKG